MKKGDIVVCINDKATILGRIDVDIPLTYGKHYTILSNIAYNRINIINDNGINDYIHYERFITLDEFREKVLDNLGI